MKVVSLLFVCMFVMTQTLKAQDAIENNIYMGVEAYGKKDYKKAYNIFLKYTNDVIAQKHLGLMYYRGEGVDKDHKESFKWMTKAASHGDKVAQDFLALMYYNGDTVEKDYKQAFFWAEKAAGQGDAHAQRLMGLMYDYGKGVERNSPKAYEWYTKAAEGGDVQSQCLLGIEYLNQQSVNVVPDLRQGFYWINKAALSGNVEAQEMLGLMYAMGEGVQKNSSMAFQWLKKAADQGLASSQAILGNMYYTGEGVTQDYVKAGMWFRKAAEQGNCEAMSNLGWLYFKGEGVTQDYQEAERLYRKCLETNGKDYFVYSNLALLYAQRDKDYEKAFKNSDTAIKLVSEKNAEAKASIYGERGLIYKWKGDEINAKRILEKCLELNPNFWKEDSDFAKLMVRYKKTVESSDSNVDEDIKQVTTTTATTTTYAVIIGNEKYREGPGVPYAENDAKVFREYAEKLLGVPNERIRYVENAGYNDLRMAMNWLIRALKTCNGKGRAIFYYAGHGIPNEKDKSAYLLPVDGMSDDPGSALSLKELYDKLTSVETESITVFLDACFSGESRGGGAMKKGRAAAFETTLEKPHGKMVVFAAAQGNQTAHQYDEKKHGMFTYYLLKKLKETDGNVSFGDLSEYLTETVKRQSFIANGKTQTPTVTPSSNILNQWRNMKLK